MARNVDVVWRGNTARDQDMKGNLKIVWRSTTIDRYPPKDATIIIDLSADVESEVTLIQNMIDVCVVRGKG